MADRRPIVTLHLPVPASLYVDVQKVFLRAYPKLRHAPMTEVMDTRATSRGQDIMFMAPEPVDGDPEPSWEDKVIEFLAQAAGDGDVDALRLRAAELLLDRNLP